MKGNFLRKRSNSLLNTGKNPGWSDLLAEVFDDDVADKSGDEANGEIFQGEDVLDCESTQARDYK